MTYDELLALCEAATEGPWENHFGTIKSHPENVVIKRPSAFDWVCSMQISNQPNCHNDAKFIIAARSEMPKLCRENARLKAELDAAKARIDELAKAEKTATMAMVYLAGQLATKEKMSPDWIQEAIQLAEKEIEKGGGDE